MPDITELTEIEPERVDGVANPASGFPILLMKAVNAQGGIDEKPDIAGAQGVIVDLFKLICSEAAEGASGAFHEICDIQMLCEAIWCLKCFLEREMGGDEDDGEPMYKELADYVSKRKFSAQRRRELASEGKALSDGSYPIENSEDLHNAAVLARSGHGNVAAAKRLIGKRAKELGVANPLASENASKEAEAVTEPEAVETSADEAVDKGGQDIDARIQEAVAKATESHEGAIKELRDELAKVKATPIPGGPAVTAPGAARAESERKGLLKEAAYFEKMAEQSTEQDMKSHYRAKAAAAREAAGG